MILAWQLSGFQASAQTNGALQAEAAPTEVAPTVAEMETFVRREWPYFRNAIKIMDVLAVEPKRVIGVPHTLCALGYDGHFFECATLVVYELPSGRPRSSLVRHYVERDDKGRLQGAVVVSL